MSLKNRQMMKPSFGAAILALARRAGNSFRVSTALSRRSLRRTSSTMLQHRLRHRSLISTENHAQKPGTNFRVVALALIALGLAGCFPRQATRIERPRIDIGPWEERTVRSAATGQVYRYMHAAGPTPEAAPLLLLHGGFFDQRMYIRMHGLSERFEVIALEWPSESPFYDGDVDDFGDVAADFLEAMELDELFVVAQSAGVWGAISLLSRPDAPQARAFVIISSVMYGISEEEIEERTSFSRRALRFSPERFRGYLDRRMARTEFPTVPGPVQLQDIFWVRPYSYYEQTFTSALNQGERRQATERITCPVLVLHGSADETMPIHAAELTPSVFPDAHFRRFEGYGHSMSFAHGPEIASAILEFVDDRGLSTERDQR